MKGYVIKSRLDVQFVRNISLEMVIGQQIEEKGMIKIFDSFYF